MKPKETMASDGSSIDPVTVSLEGPAKDKQAPTPMQSPKKIYIPIRIQTNALNNDDIAINATYISIEDLTSRVKRKEKKKGTNVEIRYMESIRSLKDKIKSTYSCSQDSCPMIKERLERHQLEHHSGTPLPVAHCCSHHDRQSQTVMSKGTINRLAPTEPRFSKSIAVSPTASILKRTPFRSMESHGFQTPSKIVDFSDRCQGSFETNLFRSDEQTQFNNDTLKARSISAEHETTITPKTSFAREDLNEEVLKWFDDIPIYPNLTSSLKNLRTNMVNEFIDKIFELSKDADPKNYERNVKTEIDNFLNALPIWYPGVKRDQDLLKEGIKNNLLKKINSIREKADNKTQIATLVDKIISTDEEIVPGRSISQLGSEYKEKIVESEILEWLMHIKFKETDEIGRTLNIIDATDIFTKRLMPLLNTPSGTKNYKLILKGLIVDTLNDLPSILHYPKNKRIYLNRIAEDLANRLLIIQAKYKSSFSCCKFPRERSMYRLTVCSNSSLKRSLLEGLSNCLRDISIDQRNEDKEEVTDIIMDCLESVRDDNKDETSNALQNSIEISKAQASVATVENVRDILTEDIINNADCRNLARSCHSGTISVFTSEQEISGPSKYPVTSTPKKNPPAKEVSKLSPEELKYMNQVSSLIRAWMELLPNKFDAPDEKEFKETMINDLAGDIMDQTKLEQLAPQENYDREKIMHFLIYKWLLKFDVFEELTEENPQVDELLKKLKEIPIPNLTKPHRGSRQAMSNIKYMESELGWKKDYVPKGIDVLEDEISIFMSELPSDVYESTDKDRQNKMVHELAGTVKKCLDNKQPESEITNEVSKWLKQMVKSSKPITEKLTVGLKDRILKLPQDATLATNLEKKLERKKEYLEYKANALNKVEDVKDGNNAATVAPDTDRTLMEFIGKFMERNYSVDDPLARGAFGELLKTEFRKLTPPTRKEVYDNFSKTNQHDDFSPERLGKELQYIKVISDWLRNIPIEASFNTPNNRTRIEFVNDLAKNFYEVEESRRKSPTAMDYDMYLASIISQSTYQLPVLPEHKDNVMLMIDQLIGMIIANRKAMPFCENANQTASSINTTGIQEQNIGEFIDNYIRLNAGEIADDQVKLDAWSARLLKEVKKLARDTADPSKLCKTEVYNKLINVPIPEEESIRIFGLELDYAKEISDWLKNLPLLPITTQEASDQRVKMISELAEKFAEREKNKVINPTETPSDSEMEEFITNWIHQIPLDPDREVVYPIVIQQLLKRIEKVNNGPEESILSQPQASTSTTNTSKKSKSKTKNKPNNSKSCTPTCGNGGKAGQSGQVLVEAIETWSNQLPIRAENKDAEQTIKDDVARKLYQKAGELSVDPQIMNDNLLYQELFTDEVNAQLNNLNSPDIEKKKESLKNDLVEKIMEAKSIIKESTAGDNYKHQLENTIDASIPNPINNRQRHNPGFEIYKKRLADIFILENFDHGNDAVKAKYEKTIKKEIDKFFQEVLKKNAVPLTKEQMYNELYSALYKVPTPNKCSINVEVEEVKTRCEVDDWFASLPVREASGVDELSERDKILSMLAKRLHEIERNEQKPDEKMHKEITKWIVKFPLKSGQEKNIDKLADDLQNRLKSSKEDRRCVPAAPLNVKDRKKGKVQKEASKTKGILGTSQVAGPSSAGQNWVSPPPAQPSYQASPIPRKKPADIMLEIVENWCASLPLHATSPQDQETNRVKREDLYTKIIIKICELNSNPQTFYDDLLYTFLLDEELEKLMSQLPICSDFKPSRENKKIELVTAINSVKCLIREERERHEYVKDLKTTVNSILPEPLDTTADKVAMFNELRDDIVDNFVQYHYNRDDDEGKQIYKAKLRDAVTKYFVDINEKPEDPPVDPLIRQNQLLCELGKISIPNERAVKDEVEDIRMKNEVKQFFEELEFPDEDEDKMTLRNNMKLSLAKRLNEIEKTGHNATNDAKMKKEISRCLKKIDKEIDPDIIQAFVDRLKSNEGARKAPPAGKSNISYCLKEPNQSRSEPRPCQFSGNSNQPTIQSNVPVPTFTPTLSRNNISNQRQNPQLRGQPSIQTNVPAPPVPAICKTNPVNQLQNPAFRGQPSIQTYIPAPAFPSISRSNPGNQLQNPEFRGQPSIQTKVPAATVPAISRSNLANQLQIPEFRGQPGSSIQSQATKSLGVMPKEYQGFGGGVLFSSSRQGVSTQMNRSLPVGSAPIPPSKPNQTAPSLEEPLREGQFMQNQGESAPIRTEGNRQRKRRRLGPDEEGTEDDCICLSRRRKMRGRPRCVLRRPDFCDECEDFSPMWRMPMPPYRFPPGYFYY
ncbi:hypothetical protein ABMA27_011120 [Loxostege sticticalis]|uniref:Uncharacterized protein n=1 Tax=Loxostege sticticalis TaxID=481309 RepID=A0ABR3H3E9_LOXSC